MNSGAIKLSESRWKKLGSGPALDLIEYIHEVLQPGYSIKAEFQSEPDTTYFIGSSDQIFDSEVEDGYYPVYKIISAGKYPKISKTEEFVKL